MRNFAVVFLYQVLAQGHNAFGFVIKQADGFNIFLEFVYAEVKYFLRCVGNFKQCFSGFVDAFVRRLSGQDNRNQQSIGIFIIQFATWVGVALVEDFHNLKNFFGITHQAFTPPAPVALGALLSKGQRGRGLKSRSLV